MKQLLILLVAVAAIQCKYIQSFKINSFLAFKIFVLRSFNSLSYILEMKLILRQSNLVSNGPNKYNSESLVWSSLKLFYVVFIFVFFRPTS